MNNSGGAPIEEVFAHDEPRLKYQRVAGEDVVSLLGEDSISCLAVTDKVLVLGLHSGKVVVTDVQGNIIKLFHKHGDRVNDLSLDEKVEFVGSCSEDGSVSINSLYQEESYNYKYGRSIKSLALDPMYDHKKSNKFVSGGLSGTLRLHTKFVIKSGDETLHTGEGPITMVRWAKSLVAWCNNTGVKIYDLQSRRRTFALPYPEEVDHPEEVRCHLFWVGGQFLYVAWGKTLQIVKFSPSSGKDGAQVLCTLKNDYFLCGVAPFGNDIAVLAYHNTEPKTETSPSGSQLSKNLPQLKILTRTGGEIVSEDLPMHGAGLFHTIDYQLVSFYPIQMLDAVKEDPKEWWKRGGSYEPLYFIVCPKDIVQGRPKDSVDRIQWLVEKGRLEEALAVAKADPSVPLSLRKQVVEKVLDQLLKDGRYEEAANRSTQLLGQDAGAWERWIHKFARERQIQVIASLIPTANPRLRSSSYEMVLNTLLQTPRLHPLLLEILQKWPIELYSLKSITENAVNKLRSMKGDSPSGAIALMETLAFLYKLQGRHDLALAIYLRLKLPTVFEFIKRHHLYNALGDKVPALFAIDHVSAIDLFVGQLDVIPPSAVVPRLQERYELSKIEQAEAKAQETGESATATATSQDDWRKYIHMYLNRVFQIDRMAAFEFHDLQVELYADYEPEVLMEFLRSSQHYRLEQAHAICKQRGFVKEMVYLLGRMGNLKQAVRLIVEDMKDVPQAILFITQHNDEELWDLLIELGMKDEAKLGTLLDTVGAHINPERVIREIPEEMEVSRLQDRLVYIIRDYKLQMQLTRGSSTIIRSDCISLSGRLYREVRAAVHSEEGEDIKVYQQPYTLHDGQQGVTFHKNGVEKIINLDEGDEKKQYHQTKYKSQLQVRQFKPPRVPGSNPRISEVASLVS